MWQMAEEVDKRVSLDGMRLALIVISSALFFLMLVVPTAYKELKGLLLALLVGLLALAAKRGTVRFMLHRSVLWWLVILVSTGAFFYTAWLCARRAGSFARCYGIRALAATIWGPDRLHSLQAKASFASGNYGCRRLRVELLYWYLFRIRDRKAAGRVVR